MDGTSGEKGSGMGLTLVNDIIQKHGGSIWVETEPGKDQYLNLHYRLHLL